MAFYFDVGTMQFEDAERERRVYEQHGPFGTRAEAEQARKTYWENQWAPAASYIYYEE